MQYSELNYNCRNTFVIGVADCGQALGGMALACHSLRFSELRWLNARRQ